MLRLYKTGRYLKESGSEALTSTLEGLTVLLLERCYQTCIQAGSWGCPDPFPGLTEIKKDRHERGKSSSSYPWSSNPIPPRPSSLQEWIVDICADAQGHSFSPYSGSLRLLANATEPKQGRVYPCDQPMRRCDWEGRKYLPPFQESSLA